MYWKIWTLKVDKKNKENEKKCKDFEVVVKEA